MQPTLRIAMVLAVLVGVWFTFLRPREFIMPEQFPVLSSDETKSSGSLLTNPQLATFGTGCFWCTEAAFQSFHGVTKVTSGYSGGSIPNPKYEQICSGTTGHAEVIQVTYDPQIVSYAELLELFWRSHDPTTKNRQGNDVGPQYRSVVFYHNDTQKELAERYRKKIDEAKVYLAPIVTEISPFTVFYPAEAYHQNYFNANPRDGYCRAIIGPKLEKLKKVFAERMIEKREPR